YIMHYNVGRIHKALRVTPAMEAEITDHVWSAEGIARLSASSRLRKKQVKGTQLRATTRHRTRWASKWVLRLRPAAAGGRRAGMSRHAGHCARFLMRTKL